MSNPTPSQRPLKKQPLNIYLTDFHKFNLLPLNQNLFLFRGKFMGNGSTYRCSYSSLLNLTILTHGTVLVWGKSLQRHSNLWTKKSFMPNKSHTISYVKGSSSISLELTCDDNVALPLSKQAWKKNAFNAIFRNHPTIKLKFLSKLRLQKQKNIKRSMMEKNMYYQRLHKQ